MNWRDGFYQDIEAREREISMTTDYVEVIHFGLVRNGGFAVGRELTEQQRTQMYALETHNVARWEVEQRSLGNVGSQERENNIRQRLFPDDEEMNAMSDGEDPHDEAGLIDLVALNQAQFERHDAEEALVLAENELNSNINERLGQIATTARALNFRRRVALEQFDASTVYQMDRLIRGLSTDYAHELRVRNA